MRGMDIIKEYALGADTVRGSQEDDDDAPSQLDKHP